MHSTLPTNHLLIYNKHMVHENDNPNLSKQLKGATKYAKFKKITLSNGSLVACEQDNCFKKLSNSCFTLNSQCN